MFWDTLRSDIRHTLRIAVKSPLFTALTVLTLALGIGATSSIVAVVNGVLLRSLPYRDTDRLVNVWSNATIAAIVPGTRAMRVDPMMALRYE